MSNRSRWDILQGRLAALESDAQKIRKELAWLDATPFGGPCMCGKWLASEGDFARHFTVTDFRYLGVGSCPVIDARTAELPEDMGVIVEFDPDFDPATSVDWPDDDTRAYVQAFADGRLFAYGVTLVRGPEREHVASVWGNDCDVSNADGFYGSFAGMPEPLRQVARDMLAETITY